MYLRDVRITKCRVASHVSSDTTYLGVVWYNLYQQLFHPMVPMFLSAGLGLQAGRNSFRGKVSLQK